MTDVDVGTSFAVVSGHEPERTDWRAFDRIPTLVVLMGGAALPTIAGELVAQGREASTPVSLGRPLQLCAVSFQAPLANPAAAPVAAATCTQLWPRQRCVYPARRCA